MIEIAAKQIAKLCINIEKFGHVSEEPLSYEQYLAITILRTLNPAMPSPYLDNLIENHPAAIYIVDLLVTMLIAVPFNSCIVFLASYTQLKIVRIWNCVPALKGFGYTLMIYHDIQLIYANMKTTELIYLLKYRNPKTGLSLVDESEIWKSCDYEGAENCIPLNDKPFACVEGNYYIMGLLQYIRMFVVNYYPKNQVTNKSEFNADSAFIMFILWTTIATVSFIGLRRILKFFNFAYMLMLGMHLAVFIATIVKAPTVSKPSVNVFGGKTESETYFYKHLSFWFRLIVYSSGSMDTGPLIWLGTLKPLNIKPVSVTIVISMVKMLCVPLRGLLVRYSMDYFTTKYRTHLEHCSMAKQHLLPFYVQMLILLELPQPKVWFSIYLLHHILSNILDSVVCGALLLDSLLDAFPILQKNRLLICISFYGINFLLSLTSIAGLKYNLDNIWVFVSVIIGAITYCIVAITFNYVYSLEMLRADYKYTYGKNPPIFMTTLWSTSPAISLFALAMCCYWISLLIVPEFRLSRLWCILLTLVICSPLLLVSVIVIANGLGNSSYNVDKPVDWWGPYNVNAKERRKKYVTIRDLKYRNSTVCCRHKCLWKVPLFAEEQSKQRTKYLLASRRFKTYRNTLSIIDRVDRALWFDDNERDSMS